jgi:hypothetical protein
MKLAKVHWQDSDLPAYAQIDPQAGTRDGRSKPGSFVVVLPAIGAGRGRTPGPGEHAGPRCGRAQSCANTDFICVYSSIDSLPYSRPQPDCL